MRKASLHLCGVNVRWWLKPLSWLYEVGAVLRNKQYDWGWRRSVRFDVPVIGVGNLSAGGNGKTPMTEYLVALLLQQGNVGVLSRGYGRRSSGFRWVTEQSSADEVGDEPLQIKRKFPQAAVAVCADRVAGISWMVAEQEQLQAVILDDAFQHRAIEPALSILVTSYYRPYWQDALLPAGLLREPVQGMRRADAVVVTKAPDELTEASFQLLKQQADVLPGQQFFVSGYRYGKPYGLLSGSVCTASEHERVLLVTGIADATPLELWVRGIFPQAEFVRYGDHYRYCRKDVMAVLHRLQQGNKGRTLLLTTEKDGMRLLQFADLWQAAGTEPYCIPVHLTFDAAQQQRFDRMVLSFVKTTDGYD